MSQSENQSQNISLTASVLSNLKDCRVFLDNLREAIFIFSIKEGEILDATKKTEEIFGYSIDEIKQKNINDLLAGEAPYTAGFFRQYAEKAFDKNGIIFEWKSKNKENKPVWVEIILQKIVLNGKECAIAIIEDITKRMLAEKYLSESEARYRSIFEQDEDAIVLIDPETGRFAEYNKAAYENLGYTREEFKDMRLTDFEVNESPKETEYHMKNILANGLDVFETRHRAKTGEIRNVLVNVRKIKIAGKDYLHGVFRDITDQKEAEDELNKKIEQMEFMGRLNLERHKKMLKMQKEIDRLREIIKEYEKAK